MPVNECKAGNNMAHLALSISRGESRRGIGALCIGGGMGIATLLTSADE